MKTVTKIDRDDSLEKITTIDAIVDDIIERAKEYMGKSNAKKHNVESEIRRAYHFAENAHRGQMRHSGEPYIIHPVEATKELLLLKPDLVTIQACLLHDVPEDTSKTIEDIEANFWKEVAYITAGMEKVSKLKYRGEERTIGSLRKMFVAMSEDLRVIFVKLADRIHNMKTLRFHPNPEKQRRIALETLNIYAPIADRLGIYEFKESLERECFRILYPSEFEAIRRQKDLLSAEQEIFIKEAKKLIKSILPETIPVYEISSRVKSSWGIYKKMQKKGYQRVQDIYDVFAIRVITDTIPHCYEILWLVHSNWMPVPRRFKDYIALKKENGYQSLHTTVVGIFPERRMQPTEVQIRTQEMHEHAEIGIAAHFEYSEKWKATNAEDIGWVSEIKSIIANTHDGEFMNQMKIHVFDDRIFVFTPGGDVINLPKWSTPIDFAYTIHSAIGNKAAFARVNGQITPLDQELHSGDSVEIITEKSRSPSASWLSFVKTTRAKEVIRTHVNKSQRSELIEKGRFILNSYLLKNFWKTLDKDMTILAKVDGHTLGMKERDDLLVQIWNLARKPSSLIKSIGFIKQIHAKKKDAHVNHSIPGAATVKPESIIIGGQNDIPYSLAKCCNPTSKDNIIGYVSKRGICIHTTACSFLKRWNRKRFLPAGWLSKGSSTGFTMTFDLVMENKIGVLKKLTNIFFIMNLNIEEITQTKGKDNCAIIRFIAKTESEDYYLFDRLIERIKIGVKEFRDYRLLDIK